jgi:hypothetical protein
MLSRENAFAEENIMGSATGPTDAINTTAMKGQPPSQDLTVGTTAENIAEDQV